MTRENLSGALGQLIRATETDAVYLKADSMALWGWVADAVTAVADQEGVGFYFIFREIVR